MSAKATKANSVYIPENISLYSLMTIIFPKERVRLGGKRRLVIYWYDKKGRANSLGSMGSDRVFRFTKVGVFLLNLVSDLVDRLDSPEPVLSEPEVDSPEIVSRDISTPFGVNWNIKPAETHVNWGSCFIVP